MYNNVIFINFRTGWDIDFKDIKRKSNSGLNYRDYFFTSIHTKGKSCLSKCHLIKTKELK
jgi:hypothetical protein